MEKNVLEREIAEMIIGAVKGPTTKGRESRMIKVGHFNGRVFNIEYFLKQSFAMVVRILVNLAMEMNHKSFMQLWNNFGERIYETAEDHGDAFNAAHKRTKR